MINSNRRFNTVNLNVKERVRERNWKKYIGLRLLGNLVYFGLCYIYNVRFHILTLESTEVTAFWDMATSTLIADRRFRGKQCLHYQSDGGCTHFWNVGVGLHSATSQTALIFLTYHILIDVPGKCGSPVNWLHSQTLGNLHAFKLTFSKYGFAKKATQDTTYLG